MIFDEEAARADDRKEVEDDVVDDVVIWAESRGWLARPMKYRDRRGCADYFFFGFGTVVQIEFKRAKGGRLSGNQVREHERMASAGLKVHVCNDPGAGIAILQEFMK